MEKATVLAESSEYILSDYSEKVKIQSRAAFLENGLEADFAGGGFAVSLNCEGDVKLKFSWSGAKGMLGVVINDDFENVKLIKVTEQGEQAVTIAENLAKGDYTIEITKQNPQYTNQVVFKSLEFSGEMLEKPLDKELKIEFYGDSISTGVGALSDSISGSGIDGYEDSLLYSYNACCARQLCAEISACALPGYGYLYKYDTGLGGDVYQYMDKALVNKDIDFDHSQYIADIVVIELGTNDRNYINNKGGEISDNEINKVVQNYIDKIRSYNKDCWIVLMGTFSPDSSFNINKKSGGRYMKLHNALLLATAVNKKTYYIEKFSTPLTGRGWHPNQAQCQQIGKTLADFISENILSGKEPPATILPSEFYLNYDINSDDKLSAVDALYMRNYLLKKISSITDEKADCNKDGKADMTDYYKLRKKLAELE